MIYGFGHVTFCVCAQTFQGLLTVSQETATSVVVPGFLHKKMGKPWQSQKISLIGPTKQIEVTNFESFGIECPSCTELGGKLTRLVQLSRLPEISLSVAGFDFLRTLVGGRALISPSGLQIRAIGRKRQLRVMRGTSTLPNPRPLLDQHGLVSIALYCSEETLGAYRDREDLQASFGEIRVAGQDFRLGFLAVGELWIELINKVA